MKSQALAESKIGLELLLNREGKVEEAREWLLKAAEQGSGFAKAQDRLGSLLEAEGTLGEAKKWYLQAAKQGLAVAQNHLGVLFQNEGKVEEAKECYLQAQQGSIEARFNLGLLLKAEGKVEEAKEWQLKGVSDYVLYGLGSHNLIMEFWENKKVKALSTPSIDEVMQDNSGILGENMHNHDEM